MHAQSSLNRVFGPVFLGGLLASTAWSQSTAKVLTPPSPGTGFGYAVADLGDVDGDGVHDIAIGAPGDHTAGLEAGAFHVYSGATATLLYTVLGPGPVSFFGRDLTVVGDVDFDGKNDFIERRVQYGYLGHVTLYSGATGQPFFTVDGVTVGAQNGGFGIAADTYGDFDGDGRADILVSAPSATGGGRVFILSGANGAVLQSVTSGPNGGLGLDVAALGDVDGDSVPDFAAVGYQGSLRVASVFSAATGTVINSFTYPSGSTLLVRGAADFNGDGRRDLLIARRETSIEVFDVVTSAALVPPIFPPTCEQSAVLCPTCPAFAMDVVIVGDRDGDGLSDVAELNGRYMRWSILSSATGLRQFHFADTGFLWSAVATNDWDGDGKDDLIVGFYANVERVVVASGRNPIQGTPIAFGDGTGAACPCGNFAQAGAGCANSSGLGARLLVKGSASLALNNLSLETTQIHPGAYSMLISGSSAQAGGLGIPFRDGLLAAGGTITRMRVQLAACPDGMVFGPGLATITFPSPWSAGNTYALQVWYRDSTGPCGQASNLTNGVSITFTP